MPSTPLIEVNRLCRDFSVAESTGDGFIGSVRNLFSRKKKTVHAVSDVSFNIGQGEFIGYVGENGAGKSTTIKILTGVLTPTCGYVTVAGLKPYENRKANASNIGVVFGQRSQLWWDLPVKESFDLLRAIFRVEDKKYKKNLEELSFALDLEKLMDVPVRKLSLGQRMRCDLTAALLHSPKVLFLDEPTIGLDLIAKDQVRLFLKRINEERGTTILLTTHDMDDIEALCNRIIILDEGKLVYDDATASLKSSYIHEKILKIEFFDDNKINIEGVSLLKQEGSVQTLSFDTRLFSVQSVITKIMNNYDVKDIAIHEPKVGDVIKNIYENGNIKNEPAVPTKLS